MSKKFFEIADAIYEGNLPAGEYWIILPNAIFLGKICSEREIIAKIKATSSENDVCLPIEKAMENVAAKMTMIETAEKNPEALTELIVTMVDVTVLVSELELHVPLAHILAERVIAWGPGPTVGVYVKEQVKSPSPQDRV